MTSGTCAEFPGLYTARVSSTGPSSRVLRFLGLAAWLAAGAPVWVELARRPDLLLAPRWAAWLALFCAFGAGHWLALSLLERGRPGHACRALVAAQTLAALGLAAVEPRGLLGVLLVVVAAQLPAVMAPFGAWSWMIAQTVALVAIFVPSIGTSGALTLGTAIGAFQGFSLYTWDIAARERQATQELARVNGELLAAQGLLAGRSRAAERLRISRDLHDVAGHHLTALSLALEAARHSPTEQVGELLERAQVLTRRLLQDVRRVVSALRESEVEDLGRALEAVSAGIERPHVHLATPEALRIEDPDKADAALRCVQEIVTNTMKHSDAQNLWLEITPSPGGMTIRAHDDGHGTSAIRDGLGLRGMKERLEALGGRVNVASTAGRGFEVEAWIPLAGAGG